MKHKRKTLMHSRYIGMSVVGILLIMQIRNSRERLNRLNDLVKEFARNKNVSNQTSHVNMTAFKAR